MNSISKNTYIDDLDEIATEYKNTHHSKVKRTLMMLHEAHILSLSLFNMEIFLIPHG